MWIKTVVYTINHEKCSLKHLMSFKRNITIPSCINNTYLDSMKKCDTLLHVDLLLSHSFIRMQLSTDLCDASITFVNNSYQDHDDFTNTADVKVHWSISYNYFPVGTAQTWFLLCVAHLPLGRWAGTLCCSWGCH